jgi:hypothetical protein
MACPNVRRENLVVLDTPRFYYLEHDQSTDDPLQDIWRRTLTMKLKVFFLCLCLVPIAGLSPCNAQTKSPVSAAPSSKEALSELQRSMPSQSEFSDLLAKADQKVSTFEAAVKNAKPYLDKIDTKYAANYLDAAATAHELISQALKNGSSAYGLVALLTTLDDLSLDAASGNVLLMSADIAKGKLPDAVTGSAVFALSMAGTACNDIAELIFHATMRLIAAEETALGKLVDDQK